MFPWQVFGLCRLNPTYPDFPELALQCRLKNIPGLSYLLTAAGQFRTLTGFPFHTPG